MNSSVRRHRTVLCNRSVTRSPLCSEGMTRSVSMQVPMPTSAQVPSPFERNFKPWEGTSACTVLQEVRNTALSRAANKKPIKALNRFFIIKPLKTFDRKPKTDNGRIPFFTLSLYHIFGALSRLRDQSIESRKSQYFFEESHEMGLNSPFK